MAATMAATAAAACAGSAAPCRRRLGAGVGGVARRCLGGQMRRPTALSASVAGPSGTHTPWLHRAHSTEGRPYDVAIVGGGVIGSSIALHLAAGAGDRALRIAVVERDCTYEWASAPRSAGGIRQQFSLPVNIELSLYGVDFLKTRLQELCGPFGIDADVQFRENGYLILAPPGSGEEALRANVATQHACGATWIGLLGPAELEARFPWLSIDGVAAGAFGERNEGYFDPWALLQAMRKGAMARGVDFVPQAAEALERDSGGGGTSPSVARVRLADGSVLTAGVVVNAAGAFGGRLLSTLGPAVSQLPVAPRKRCMFQFRVGGGGAGAGQPPPPDNTPLTIDASGVYFRSDGAGGGRFVCGVSPRPADDHDCDDFESLRHPDEELFMETIWPTLAARAPALEALRVESSWAGLYEYNTMDQNGVVGWHPDVPNLLIACGFSGHGLQQSPGVGRACAELMLHGGYKTVDLSCLGFERIVKGEPLFERGIY